MGPGTPILTLLKSLINFKDQVEQRNQVFSPPIDFGSHDFWCWTKLGAGTPKKAPAFNNSYKKLKLCEGPNWAESCLDTPSFCFAFLTVSALILIITKSLSTARFTDL